MKELKGLQNKSGANLSASQESKRRNKMKEKTVNRFFAISWCILGVLWFIKEDPTQMMLCFIMSLIWYFISRQETE